MPPLVPDFLGAGIELPMAAHEYYTHYRRVELQAGGKPFNFALASLWAPLNPTKGGGPVRPGIYMSDLRPPHIGPPMQATCS